PVRAPQHIGLLLAEQIHPPLLTPHVDGQVPADAEEPLAEVGIDLGPLLRAKPYERLLDDIARPLGITGEMCGIRDQLPLILPHGLADPVTCVLELLGRGRHFTHPVSCEIWTL